MRPGAERFKMIGIQQACGITVAVGRRAYSPRMPKQSVHEKHQVSLGLWAGLINRAMSDRRLSVAALAREIDVDRASLTQWLLGRRPPDPWVLRRLCGVLMVSVTDQLLALQWASAEDLAENPPRSDVLSGDLEQEFRAVTDELVQLQARVSNMARPAFAVVKSVLEPPVSLGPHWRNRWQARLATFNVGVAYPTDWGIYVEFIRHDGAAEFDYPELRRQFASAPKLLDYIDRHVDQEIVRPTSTDSEIRRRIMHERLELQSLVAAEVGAIFGHWVGEQGITWRWHAFRNSRSVEAPYTHIYYPNEDQRSVSRSTTPRRARLLPRRTSTPSVPVATKSVDTVVVIGFGFHCGHIIGRMLAQALGWRSRNPAEVTLLRRGSISLIGWKDPQVRADLRHTHIDLLERVDRGVERFTVVTASAADIVGDDAFLERLRLLSDRQSSTAVLFVRSNQALLEAWEFDAYDNRWLTSDAPAPYNTVSAASCATARLVDEFANWPTSAYRIVDLNPRDNLLGDAIIGTRPEVSDWFTRAAYCLFRELCPDQPPVSGHLQAYANVLQRQFEADPPFGQGLIMHS